MPTASPPRHVFVQHAAGRELATLDQRAEAPEPLLGTVLEASYLTRESALVAESAEFFARLRRWIGGAPSRSKTSDGDPARFVLPFDRAGDDVLALCDPNTDVLDGHDDPLGSVRRVRGTVTCLEPRRRGDRVVLRDLWVEQSPPFRVVEAIDFGVLPANGPPVAVCCAMAPLVIAPPARGALEALLEEFEPRAREHAVSLAARAHRGANGALLRVEEGDAVEVVGVVCEPRASAPRFDVVGRSAPYRGASAEIQLIVGDEPGTRLVVRKLARA